MAVIAKMCPKVLVTVVDLSKKQIDAWNSPNLPIYEPGLEEVVAVGLKRGNLVFTTSINVRTSTRASSPLVATDKLAAAAAASCCMASALAAVN